jgi:hypothetical protein
VRWLTLYLRFRSVSAALRTAARPGYRNLIGGVR